MPNIWHIWRVQDTVIYGRVSAFLRFPVCLSDSLVSPFECGLVVRVTWEVMSPNVGSSVRVHLLHFSRVCAPLSSQLRHRVLRIFRTSEIGRKSSPNSSSSISHSCHVIIFRTSIVDRDQITMFVRRLYDMGGITRYTKSQVLFTGCANQGELKIYKRCKIYENSFRCLSRSFRGRVSR